MMDYDFIVIGAGSGGVRAARVAAQLGVRVALVEGAAVGGTCVNVGCIPKKLYAYAAGYRSAFAEAGGYGWDAAPPTLNWQKLKANRRREIDRLNGVYVRMLESAGVHLVRGWAQIAGSNKVRVDGQCIITARWILVATGGEPAKPTFEGAPLALISEQMFDLPELPRRMAVIGGGYIASEFASIFHGLGVQITQVHRGENILRGFDEELAIFAQQGLQAAGVSMALSRTVRALERTTDGMRLTLDDGSLVHVDAVLYAGGRNANLRRLGWQEAGGMTTDQGLIQVDENHRTSIPGIFAVGDVCSSAQLTPVALAQAMGVVQYLFATQRDAPWTLASLDLLPSAVFMEPCVATVGLTEAQAHARYESVEIYTSDFRPLRHALSGASARTFMKVVVDGSSRRVLGVHIAGDDAAEILQGFAVAMRAGACKEDLDSTLGIHPTSAEELCTLRTPVRVLQRSGAIAELAA